jgi:hypothetical protein
MPKFILLVVKSLCNSSWRLRYPRTMKIELSPPLMPACGRQGGGLRRELSRTIEVGVDMAYSPLPPPSPTRGEGEYWDYFLTESSLALKARGSKNWSTWSRHWAGGNGRSRCCREFRKTQKCSWTPYRYDFRFYKRNHVDHFAKLRFAWRRGVSTIPEGDTN